MSTALRIVMEETPPSLFATKMDLPCVHEFREYVQCTSQQKKCEQEYFQFLKCLTTHGLMR
jgi:hypothetical protein